MKTLWKISTFTILLFTLSACMPDSLTKFKEAPVKKGDDSTSSSGGSGADDDTTVTCEAGTDPACTSPGTFSYPSDKNYKFLINETGDNFEVPFISPSFSNYIQGHDEYISISTPANFAVETGLTIAVENESEFVGNPDRFLPKTFYEVTATYSSELFGSDESTSDTFALTIAQDLQEVIYPGKVGDKLILEVDDITPFSTQNGFNSISTANGISGVISYIDTQNKELHIDVTENSGNGHFSIDSEVDNSPVFFNKKAEIETAYKTYARDSSIQESLSPVVSGYETMTAKELASISYSIFPSLPPGLSFDTMRGTVGTLRAYQDVTDGTYSVVNGSRDIVGTGTSFLSHLQVNSTIELNGEIHKIESIESNSVARTYRPFAATANPTSFKKLLKGSVEITNGSPIITGVGTAFSSEVIPSKTIIVDAVSDFTGLTGTISSVNSDTQITLTGAFAGTALTIPEVKATNYVISAKNILEKTVSKLLTISLLNPVQPKTLSVVAYNLEINDKIVLPVLDVSSFTRGGYVSNSFGTIAQIDFIDTTGNKLFATVRQLGQYCTVTSATTSGTCTAANGDWITKNFDGGDEIDNSSSYLAAETTLDSSAILSFSISSTTIERIPVISPSGLSPTEIATLQFSISPDISSGQGFCGNPSFTNQFDCNNDTPGNWSQGLLFATVDQCSDPVHTNEADCIAAVETWIEKGTFYGVPSTPIPETEFTITTTTLLDKEIESKVRVSVSTPPAGLALTRNLLLHVPSASSFQIGDAISSRSGGLGTITGKFSVNSTPADKGAYQYSFLEVKLLAGTFLENEDLDNLPNFSSQKTYILGDGVYPYNTKIRAADTSDFVDPEYTGYSASQNLLQVGGADRARVIYNNEVDGNMYLIVYDTVASAANAEPTSLSTGDTITAPNLSPVPTELIVGLDANDIIATLGTASFGLPNSIKGYDITSNGTGIGMLHALNATGSKAYIEITEGLFNSGESLDTESPYSAPASAVTAVENDYTFYLYRGVEAAIDVYIDVSDSNTTIELDQELPDGLIPEINSNGVFRITGTPTTPSVKEKFTLTASNAFGATSYEFFLRVYDQFNLINTVASSTYILHKTGKGNGRKPCAVTEDQMNSGDIAVRDISCFLDVGEDQLHANGIQMEIQVGRNLCSNITETPLAFWNFAPGNATSASGLNFSRVYKHSGYDECTSGTRPSQEFSLAPNGASPLTGVNHPLLMLVPQTPADLCIYNYSTQFDEPDYPDCDIAEFEILEVNWEDQAYECWNTADGGPTLDSTIATCLNNNGTCSDNTFDGDKTGCDDALEVWTSEAQDNDQSDGTLPNSPTADVGFCIASVPAVAPPVECGGQTNACLGGPRSTWSSITSQDVLDGVSTVLHNMTGNPAPTSVTIDYTQGYESGDMNNNTWWGNYLKQCNADQYKPDVTSMNTRTSTLNRSTHHFGLGSHFTYQYVCKDGAGDEKARINLIVRDFDKSFKVKFGFCSIGTAFTREDCADAGGAWTQSGIDYYDPDALLGSANDPRNFLINNQDTDFGSPANRYSNIEVLEDAGGSCGIANDGSDDPTFNFNGECSVGSYSDPSSCAQGGGAWTPGVYVHPRHPFSN